MDNAKWRAVTIMERGVAVYDLRYLRIWQGRLTGMGESTINRIVDLLNKGESVTAAKRD